MTMQRRTRYRLPRRFALPLLASIALAGCSNDGGGAATTTTVADTTTVASTSSTSTTPRPELSRIQIRTVDGVAEFYDDGTGEKFTPIGVNYVDFYQMQNGTYADAVLATNVYDRGRVDDAFRTLADLDYNTVRLFFDTCDHGPNCIGLRGGSGLNPEYLDNLVDLMWIAADHGIRLILTANSLPNEGGYWALFDRVFSEGHEGFDSPPNADWLHQAGVEAKQRFWRDLMSGLADRGAPFETVLGWQLTNEFWLHRHVPPMSLTEGVARTANGEVYDMADPEQKRQMVADGTVYFIDVVRPIIDEFDPEGLVTMGFFAPYFEAENWYVDTPSIIHRANVDFWDFHAYYDTELTIVEQAESFGMIGYTEKPIVMGETGSGKAIVPSAASGLTKGLEWMAESCVLGFDGWLNWGYYPWPDEVGGPPWTFLDDDGVLLHGMAPAVIGDPCDPGEPPISNVAYKRRATASRTLDGQSPEDAVDGGGDSWNAGAGPPQWIEITLDEPTAVASVGLVVDQWPPGMTRHRVWLRLEDGRMLLAADIARFTTIDMRLGADLPSPVEGVVAVRVETLESPAWVAWREIDVVNGEAAEACLARATSGVPLMTAPSGGGSERARLGSGTWLVADGTLDGWLRIQGDGWVDASLLELAPACASVPDVDGPVLDLVSVTFSVTLPEGTTQEVFAGGSFPESGLPSWVAHTILFYPEQGLHRSTTVTIPRGTTVEYVYSIGGFEGIERSDSCGQVRTRTFVVEPGLVIEDVVAKWLGVHC